MQELLSLRCSKRTWTWKQHNRHLLNKRKTLTANIIENQICTRHCAQYITQNCLFLITTLLRSHCNYFHLTDVETESQREVKTTCQALFFLLKDEFESRELTSKHDCTKHSLFCIKQP